jgi:DNA-binding IclR family transcriptional regulator
MTRHGRSATSKARDRQFVEALARGLEILRCFTPTTPELGGSEIARLTRLPQPTVWRLCHTMLALGFLVPGRHPDRLRIGIPALGLGYAVLASHPIGELARPYMEDIAKRYQGAVSLGSRDGLSMIYLQRCQGSSIILADLRVGSRVPLGYSATGWAYLAGLPAKEREDVLKEIRRAEGKQWKTVERRFRDALASYERTGYIVNRGSLHSQINAVAVPIYLPDGSAPFTLSSGGINTVFDEPVLVAIAKELITLAELLRAVPHPAAEDTSL